MPQRANLHPSRRPYLRFWVRTAQSRYLCTNAPVNRRTNAPRHRGGWLSTVVRWCTLTGQPDRRHFYGGVRKTSGHASTAQVLPTGAPITIPMIFAVINQKGGSGKTTLAVHLACYLADQGKTVAFVDGDTQRSATKWLDRTAPNIRQVTADTAESLVHTLQAFREEVDVIVADGAPRLNESTKVLMYMADRILVPVCPSPIDLLATIETKQAIDLVQEARTADGLPPLWVRLILNRVRSVSEQGKIVSQVLRNLGIDLAEQSLGLRDAYVKAMGDDTVVTRMSMKNKGAAQAAQEITQLFSEVIPHELRHLAAA